VFNNGVLGFIELEQKSSGLLKRGDRAGEPEFRDDGKRRCAGRLSWRLHRSSSRYTQT
jgi:hypothetical protein